jgi:hypothetical protein
MKQHPTSGFYNGHLPVQQKPCTGNVAFSTGGSGAMIEYAFVIAASMRIMADTDECRQRPRHSPVSHATREDRF